ncbi:MAG TPA: hypothetical protein VGS22_28975 [Thermoanaerobaculia bacterium]|jgi:hypothetical protein|nr:hypothetical protein [Thermoanaerobaculia bacterium]
MNRPRFLWLGLAAVALIAGAAIFHAQVGPTPGPPFGNHYRCYDVTESSGFTSRSVKLKDQFGGVHATVIKPRYLCNPVVKNGEPLDDPNLHLVCYETAEASDDPAHTVLTEDQFGQLKLRVESPNLLCVPASKRILEGPGPFDPTEP